RQCENRPGRILVRLRHEWTAVRDEQVPAVVRLIPAVYNRVGGVAPHASTPHLMDDPSTRCDAVATILPRHGREHLPPHLGDKLAEGLLHVLNLVVLMVRPLPVEAQDGDPVLVHDLGIYLTV